MPRKYRTSDLSLNQRIFCGFPSPKPYLVHFVVS
jgi:hypothetical protein